MGARLNLGAGRTPLRALPAVVMVLLFGAVAGCAGFQAQRSFSAGKKAEAEGQLEEALRAYEAASAAQPKNHKYAEALTSARDATAQHHAERAQAAEAQGRFEDAATAWQAAHKAKPGDAGLAARAELARLRTQRSEPIDLYQATLRLANAVPGDATTQRALGRSRADALRYYVKLAETYGEAGAARESFEAYEKARTVDPESAIFKEGGYLVAKAKHLEVIGDERMSQGDQLGAYHAYEEAVSLADVPQIKRKLKNTKRVAGSLLEQLDQARGFASLKQWEDAAEIYTAILDRPDAPKEITSAAREARAASAALRGERAQALAERGVADQAQAQLLLALEHMDGSPEVQKELQKGIEALKAEDFAASRTSLEAAGKLSPPRAIKTAAESVLLATVKASFETAKSMADQDPAAAMLRMTRLAPFENSLPGYDAAKKQLAKRAFSALLDQAEAKARSGNDVEAAETLAAALEIARPPAKIKELLLAGTHALRGADYSTAISSYKRALDEDARSRLAQIGERIASTRRLESLRSQAAEAKRVSDTIREAAAYRAILDFAPDDAEAKAGLEQLQAALIQASVEAGRELERTGRMGGAYVYYRRALDLEPTNGEIASAIQRVLASVDRRATPVAWIPPVVRGSKLLEVCPDAERDLRERLILYLTRTRNLGAEFLQRGPNLAVDAGQHEKPAIELASVLERCAIEERAGSIGAKVEVRVGGELLTGAEVEGKFDPATLPKDEVEDAVDPKRILDAALNDIARAVANVLKEQAAKLADWRAVEARARIRARDDEAAARVYATLMMDKDKLTPSERAALLELERYVLNRFR